ncbi:MAG: RNA methyltransferase [Thermoplasmata archaeon]
MQGIRVIVVEPKNPGNLGAIARLMKNFGLDDLVIVNAYRIPSEDIFRSMKGVEILSRARMVNSLDEASSGLTYLVGTSDVKGDSPKSVLRKYLTPREFKGIYSKMAGKVGLVLGREDIGLTNDELSKCDFFVHIPSSSDYPTLNVSSAAAILFYELFRSPREKSEELASKEEMDSLVSMFKENLHHNGYPGHRIEKTSLIFRRVMSRALLSKYEHRVLMGALKCRP